VDDTQEEIIVLQGKIKQKESSIGDQPLRDLAGTLTQVEREEGVQGLIDGGGNAELKRILDRLSIKGLVSKGYSVIGAFISNQPLDANGAEFAEHHGRLRVYDRNRIASEFIDIESDGGIDGTFSFDTSYVEPLVLETGAGVKTVILPVKAQELVRMEGIQDGTLFSQNVRQSLGNTKVNKAMRASVEDTQEHKNFPLYHNGVTILCEAADIESECLKIRDYVVVNGAQSITTFKRSESKLSDDLRIIAKIIQLDDSALARRITVNSNNQNAIKPRDLKSTNEVQVRLKEEFKRVLNGAYDLEIKRGQEAQAGSDVITNEEAGRLLLAFDLMEPESCHQVYKLFDDKYADIFARPAVTAWRIILLEKIMKTVQGIMPEITYKPLSKYGLTRFFLLSTISELMSNDKNLRPYSKEPQRLFNEGKIDAFLSGVKDVMRSIIVDLNYEVEDLGDNFDYKGDLKSPTKIRELRSKLLRSFEKDVARQKAKPLSAFL